MFDVEIVDIVEHCLDLVRRYRCGVLVGDWSRDRLGELDFGHDRAKNAAENSGSVGWKVRSGQTVMVVQGKTINGHETSQGLIGYVDGRRDATQPI